MKMKRFFAVDMRSAMAEVRELFGSEAIIISNRKLGDGVEVVAAIDKNISSVEDLSISTKMQSAKEDKKTPESKCRSGKYQWAEDPSLTAIKSEVKALRGILENQLSGLAWSNLELHNPVQAMILKKLTFLGITADVAQNIISLIDDSFDEEKAWQFALAKLMGLVPIYSQDKLEEGGIISLVGPTGIGKTTTIAKLAARFVLRYGAREVALITTDSFRVAAHEQLKIYANILGVNVHVASDAISLRRSLDTLQGKRFVLIDTAGMSQRDVSLAEHLSLLNISGKSAKHFLVLSATSQTSVIEESIRRYSPLSITACILTKTDEGIRMGEALSSIIKQRLPIAYTTNGQRVPEDINVARSNEIVENIIKVVQSYGEDNSDIALALNFSKEIVNGI